MELKSKKNNAVWLKKRTVWSVQCQQDIYLSDIYGQVFAAFEKKTDPNFLY